MVDGFQGCPTKSTSWVFVRLEDPRLHIIDGYGMLLPSSYQGFCLDFQGGLSLTISMFGFHWTFLSLPLSGFHHASPFLSLSLCVLLLLLVSLFFWWLLLFSSTKYVLRPTMAIVWLVDVEIHNFDLFSGHRDGQCWFSGAWWVFGFRLWSTH